MLLMMHRVETESCSDSCSGTSGSGSDTGEEKRSVSSTGGLWCTACINLLRSDRCIYIHVYMHCLPAMPVECHSYFTLSH